MSMIERYRKSGGFVQLLNLLETTGKEKQEKFLKMIADESPVWETEVRKRLLTFDKVLGWDPTYLAEIFPRIQPIQLAMIAGGLPPEKSEAFMKVLTFKEKRQVEEVLKEKKPTPGEMTSAIMKLFSEIRKMEAEGSLKFDKFDPEMVVPEGIEEKLGKGFAIHTGPKEIEESMQSAVAGGTSVPSNVLEELAGLRKKLVSLSQENHKLQTDNKTMKEKLDQIKKIA